MLIVGGIAVVVLAALVGVVLLSMGEARAEKTPQAPKDATTSQPQVLPDTPEASPSLDVTELPTLHLDEQASALPVLEEEAAEVHGSSEQSDEQEASLPVLEAQAAETDSPTGQVVPLQKEVTLNDVSGQLYEVTDALLMLTDRVGELDERLNNLATVLEEREAPKVKALAGITDHHLSTPHFDHQERL